MIQVNWMLIIKVAIYRDIQMVHVQCIAVVVSAGLLQGNCRFSRITGYALQLSCIIP